MFGHCAGPIYSSFLSIIFGDVEFPHYNATTSFFLICIFNFTFSVLDVSGTSTTLNHVSQSLNSSMRLLVYLYLTDHGHYQVSRQQIRKRLQLPYPVNDE